MASVVDGIMRRIQHALTFGSTTTESDDSGPVQTVQVKKNDIQTQDAVPIAFPYGFSSHAPIGANVLHVGVSGDLSNGVIISKIHPQSRPRNLQPGCTVAYDQIGTRMDFTNDGNATISGTGTLYLNFAEVVVNGDVVAKGVSLIHHLTSNAGGSGNSGPPIAGG